MKNINLEELKRIELEILSQVDEVCEAQGIKYSLTGGTLLGAVRHKGYIPWDDDIDICMPRPDYNRFIAYCKSNDTIFQLISNETNSKYSYLFAKAINPNTIITEENSNRDNIELGVYIDIFPIDGLGNTLEEAKKIFSSTRFEREMLVAYNWKHFFKSKTKTWVYEPIRLIFFFMSRFVSSTKLINRIQSKYVTNNFESSKYVGAVCGSYREKEIAEKDIFDEFENIIFENREFKSIKKKEVYLSSIYGDYMKLPPKEKQISHHTFKAYYK